MDGHFLDRPLQPLPWKRHWYRGPDSKRFGAFETHPFVGGDDLGLDKDGGDGNLPKRAF